MKPTTETIVTLRQKFITPENTEWADTRDLRENVGHELRTGGTLTASTWDRLLDWKLRGQRGRAEARRESITPEMLREVLGCFWRLHQQGEPTLGVQLGVLCALPGVDMGVSTAILALGDPRDYGVIDVRNWQALYGAKRTTFTFGDYQRYLESLRALGQPLKMDVQEVDYLLWKAGEG